LDTSLNQFVVIFAELSLEDSFSGKMAALLFSRATSLLNCSAAYFTFASPTSSLNSSILCGFPSSPRAFSIADIKRAALLG
jgi:hypothetical protein